MDVPLGYLTPTALHRQRSPTDRCRFPRDATLLEVGYVIFFGTFVSYLLMINGQRTLRPTVVSMYNYMQPMVAVVVSITLGLAVFTPTHALAVALIFSGVWLVAIARSGRKG